MGAEGVVIRKGTRGWVWFSFGIWLASKRALNRGFGGHDTRRGKGGWPTQHTEERKKTKKEKPNWLTMACDARICLDMVFDVPSPVPVSHRACDVAQHEKETRLARAFLFFM